jgi:hypothetical protein
MSQITLAIRHAPQSERLLHWQMTVNAAFAGGTLTAALLNLGALIAFSLTRSVLSRFATAPSVEEPHG